MGAAQAVSDHGLQTGDMECLQGPNVCGRLCSCSETQGFLDEGISHKTPIEFENSILRKVTDLGSFLIYLKTHPDS